MGNYTVNPQTVTITLSSGERIGVTYTHEKEYGETGNGLYFKLPDSVVIEACDQEAIKEQLGAAAKRIFAGGENGHSTTTNG